MEPVIENKKIEIEQQTLDQLNTARKWAMFLSIVGFIFLGLLLIMGLIAGTFLKIFNSGGQGVGIPEVFVFIFMLLLAIIYFFPVLFLFRFSKLTSLAIQSLDKQVLHKAFANLKYYFVYIGVLIILVLAFYFIVLVVAGSSVAFLKGLG